MTELNEIQNEQQNDSQGAADVVVVDQNVATTNQEIIVVPADNNTEQSVNVDIKTEPSIVVEPTVVTSAVDTEKQIEDIDPFPVLEKKFGRKFTEEDLTTDWKVKANEAEEKIKKSLEEAEKFKYIFENKDFLQIADLMKNGKSAKDILEAMSIDPTSIPTEQKILDNIKREHPYLKTKEDIELFARTNFAYGESLEDLKDIDPERYFKVIKNIDAAVQKEDEFLNNKKIELLNTPAPAQNQQAALVDEQQVLQFQNSINQHIDSLTDLKVTDDFAKPFDKAALKSISENISYSGEIEGKNFTILKDVSANEVMEALYFLRNKTTLLGDYKTELETKITKEKSIKAFQDVSKVYDNVQGSPNNTNSTGLGEVIVTAGGYKV